MTGAGMSKQWDVVVVGAGLAGLRAARDCAEAGLSVLVLEARDRVGGRGFTGGADVLGVDVELGGTWIAPRQTQVWSELARYGLDSRAYEAPTEVRWRTGGVLHRGLPVAFEHWLALEATLVRIHSDAMLEPAPDGLRALSCQAYIEQLDVPEPVGDFLHGWIVMITGAHPAEVTVMDVLSVVADQGGVAGLITALLASPVPGWTELGRRMAADVPDVRLGTAVTGVRRATQGLEVLLANGAVEPTVDVVLAVPVNVLPSLDLGDLVPKSVSAGAGRNVGRVAKVWMLVDGVPAGALAAGRGEGLDWLYAAQTFEGHTLMLGFGLPGADFVPSARRDVERALHAFYPDAVLVASHHHDWVADPWSRGTYVATPAGAVDTFAYEKWSGGGPLHFAGSDIAAEHSGWFEGALVSGRDVAAQIIASRSGVTAE